MADPRQSRLQIVEELPDALAEKPDPFASAGFAALTLGLKTLSQRAVASAKTWFTLASVGSAFWLWFSIQNPSPTQLVSLGMYAAFILAANLIVRRF